MPESILRRIAEGDRSAVEDCIARYGPLVWSLARRLGGDRSDAEDAVQEIFIDLWSSAGGFDPSRSAEPTFVAMIARRRLIDRRRRRDRRPPCVSLLGEPSHPDADQAAALERRDEAARALEAMAQLRDEQRRVLRLSLQQGLTYDEIARATRMPLGTVKTHARRGLIRLRALLGADRPAPATARQGGGP